MGAPDFVVRWADFDGGDYGTLDPSRANKNQFSGINVLKYNSGLLGPRPGLKQLGVTYASGNTTHPTIPGPYGFDVHDDELLVTLADETMRIPFNDTQPITATLYDAYTAPATEFVRFAQGERVLYALINGDLWKHADDGTVTKITLPGSLKLANLVRWGYYLVGVDTLTPYRIWHSTVTIAGPDFDTWGANSYLDVGSNLPINSLKPVGNTLYAGKSDGWWAVSGILGEMSAVRQRTVANGPTDDRNVCMTTDNRLLYWPQDSVPAWFNGDRTFLDRDYELTGFQTQFECDTVVSTPTGQRLIMIGERTDQATDPPQSGMLLWDKAWSSHVFDIPIGGIALGDVRDGTMLPEGVVFMIQRPTAIGDPLSIVSFQTDGDRPAHADDDWAAPADEGSTDMVTGTVELPAHWDGQGRFMRVTNVVVQFRKWPSGVAETRNEMHLKVKPLGLYDGGTIDSEVLVWSEPSDRADRLGTDDSFRVSPGEMDWCGGFQIQFPVLRGVAIREVIASVEVRQNRT